MPSTGETFGLVYIEALSQLPAIYTKGDGVMVFGECRYSKAYITKYKFYKSCYEEMLQPQIRLISFRKLIGLNGTK